MASVKVAVRVRPLNKREKLLSSTVIIHMKGNTTTIDKSSPFRGDDLKERSKTFSYDFSYDSTNPGSPTFASQERIFHDLGSDVLKAAFEGFNACVLAYGQTGSGKSYTMMGHQEDAGLIPRICEGLFQEISRRSKGDTVSYRTEVSYLEIYNERVQDLLKSGGVLRVREHPRDGPYVENLSKHSVHNHSEMEELIVLGNANRTTAKTGMNDSSSRSHAIFTVSFTQAWFDGDLPRETLSKIHLVDLAGSERAGTTRTTGTRLKEGANINKSLVTLGSVISALADFSAGAHKKKQIFIPYRDSVLTWLLKDSLGGNSVTTMIATVSPADVNYGETLSTLRYASRAKTIVNTPTVNEVGSVKIIRELQAEVMRLRKLLEETGQVSHEGPSSSVKVAQELHHNEAKVLALTKEWTNKWEETHRILQEQAVALRKEGSGVVLDCGLPHLISLDDLLSTGIMLYYIKDGRTLIGSDKHQNIVLHGPGLLREHCVLENCAGTVTLIPQDGAHCSVDGSVVTSPCQLTQGATIKLGTRTVLRFNHPTEATQVKEKSQNGLPSGLSPSMTDTSTSTENLSEAMLKDPGLDAMAIATVKVEHSCQTSATTENLMDAATPEKSPLKITFELDGDALQGGVSTRESPEQAKDLCHKSGLGLVSERPQREALSGAGAACYEGKDWSGDANLQQTSVLGPGDGCDTKPEGNANETSSVVADCYEGRPGSGGSSLGDVSHLQSNGGTSPMPIPPQTSTPLQLSKKLFGSQVDGEPPKETTFKGRSRCGEMDEYEGLEDIPVVCELDSVVTEALAQDTGRSSLVSKVSWIVQDARRLLWRSPAVLQQVRKEGLHPVGARLSSHVVSLVRKSSALSVVKDSQALSVVKGSFVFSLVKDSYIFSVVKELPLIQHIQKEINQHLQLEEAAQIIHSCISPDTTQLSVLTQTQTFSSTNTLSDDLPLIREEGEEDSTDVMLQQKHDVTGDKPTTDEEQKPEDASTEQIEEDVQIFNQTLTEFPACLVNLQTLPLPKMTDAFQSVISTSVLTSQKIKGLYWLHVAKCSQPEPRPALLVLMEAGLYALTTDSDSGLLVLFHHLPLLQLKEVQIGLAGHSVRLTGTTEDSILGVYTYSQETTKELCRAVLGVLCPGDSRVSHHPLLQEDLMKMSLNWQACVPDLLLDAGLRVCGHFQKNLADLVYFLHCNMDQSAETGKLGEVQILLYASVGVHTSPSTHTKPLAQLFLTDTHLGLLQEEATFHPTPCRPQFHDLTLRPRSDIRSVLVCDEDESRAVRLDVILSGAKGRGHPESVTEAAGPSAHASNSPPDAEVWKLTFNCSTEAACLINHLSNVRSRTEQPVMKSPA